MLIKIETYEDNRGIVASTLHACLATSKEDGCLFSGGRKSGDITFASDKSVSRQHCFAHCIGLFPGMVKPRNDEEKEACSTNEYRMCLVYENTGKGGSFVACEDTGPSLSKSGDDSETDEETDDEGISQQSSGRGIGATAAANSGDLPPVAAVTREYFGSKPVKLKKIDVGQRHIVSFDSGKSEVIQLGRFESVVKITLAPLRVMFSNMKTIKFEETIMPKLHTIGGIRVEDTGHPSHLVTEELNAGAKQIMAWSQELPMVRIGFLQALIDRKSSTDPMPDPRHFPITKNSDKSINFWGGKPNRKLLANFTLLSVEPGTFETLAVAAGVKRLPLHEMAATDEEQLRLAQAAISSERNRVCFTSKTRKRVTKKIAALNVPLVDLKKLAKSVTGQVAQLIDTTGTVLTPSTMRQSASSACQVSKRTQEETPELQEREEETPPELETTPYDTQCLLDPASQPFPANGSPMPDQASPSQADTRIETIPEESIEAPQPDEESGDNVMAESETKKPSQNSSRSFYRTTVDDSADKLEAADKNGWFTTAPKEKNIRKQWRERSSNLNQDENLDFNTTIETETLTVVAPMDEAATWRVPPGRKRKGVPDFRKFRKNVIMDRDSAVTIDLRLVEPQEIEDQQAFEEHERAFAEEQRLADALFGGDGAVGARKRRRRIA